jgi:hypothetical protein
MTRKVVDDLKEDPSVSIIVLNWKGWNDTIECLESLYQIAYSNYQVIVVDNGSNDDSLKKIIEFAEGKLLPNVEFIKYSKDNKPVKVISYKRAEAEGGGGREKELIGLPSSRKLVLIANDENLGFSEGNNVGIRYALKALNPDYVMLLNNDTVVDRDFLGKLIDIAETRKDVGAIGPKMLFYNYKGSRDVVAHRGGELNWLIFPGYRQKRIGSVSKRTGRREEIVECDWISGAAMMIRTSLLRDSLLNSDFFFGCEDVELCIKIRRKGYKVLMHMNSVIWHKIGVARNKKAGKTFNRDVRDIIYNFRFTFRTTRGFPIYIPMQTAHLFFKLSREFLFERMRHPPV